MDPSDKVEETTSILTLSFRTRSKDFVVKLEI